MIVIFAIFYLILGIAPLLGLALIGYGIVSLPMRRMGRARLFLDLIETGITQGQRPEETIASAGETNDPSLGWAFRRVAAHVQSGLRLSMALDLVPRLLPPEMRAMLKAGERIGDIQKVFPACRQLLQDNGSHSRTVVNYLLIFALFTSPGAIYVLAVLRIYVFPQLNYLYADIGASVPATFQFLQAHPVAILGFQLLLLLFVWAAVFIYAGGTQLFSWLQLPFSPFSGGLACAIPWRRKRLQRDFSAMLAILLDSGMPEKDALALAAGCTANAVFVRRAEKACSLLAAGATLPEAMNLIDSSGEFRWRMTNALRAHRDFFVAIKGWNESLDAKAFQQEQATAQLITTGLVFLNGAVVALIVVSVFGAIISISNGVSLW